MYIKSIVLDGFKSYGNRVEINGFDREFNAITGLNGTGKSNILDSICFVLGITNLSHVRAGSLQDLVYKSGQAGITKATVSITFDNRDKSQCPIGYESHNEITITRQVVMGGKNKYLINGINVQNKRVTDLFCSIQLNVNNPHFLIMQGRITKVLNMKPPEILSMVEEAAGTRMYEAKKQMAQKTIEKKDAKLRELNDIITEDIAPKLQKLQDERSQFQEYQKVVRELENLTRLYVAWKYVTAEENAKEAEQKVEDVKDAIKAKKNDINANENECREIDKKVVDLNRKLDEESGNILKDLEKEHQKCEEEEAVANSAVKTATESVQMNKKKKKLLMKNLADDEKTLAAKKATLDDASSTFGRLREASELSAKQLAEAQERFLAISSGLEGEKGASASLQDQLMAAKQESSEANTRVSQSTMELKHCQERLRSLQRDFKSSSAQFQKDQDNITSMEREVKKLEADLSRINYSEDRLATLTSERRAAQLSLQRTRDRADMLAARLQRCSVQYTDPEPGFDRRRVAGTVCRLLAVRDNVYCTALETAAGGKLYNVIVDTEVTSKLILQRGQLQTRTTIIPLNKIHGSVIDRRTVEMAQQVGGGPENVQLALDLISYDPKLRPAMQWVFGQTLVCRDLDTARRVTFHPRVMRRCVTLDGDVVDPSGTLSGGAKAKGGSILVQLNELKTLESELDEQEAALSQYSVELTALNRSSEAYHTAKQRYELLSHELQVVKDRLRTTSHHQMHLEIEQLTEKVQELTRGMEEDKAKQKEAAALAKELELKMKDLKGHREREFKKAEDSLKQAKKAAASSESEWKKREQEFETLNLEVSELARTVEGTRQQLETEDGVIAELGGQLERAEEMLAEVKEKVKSVLNDIKAKKAEIASKNKDIAKIIHKKEELAKANSEIELQIKELNYKVTSLETEAKECQQKIKSLRNEHDWIESERRYFGSAGGLYDFAARDPSVAGARLAQLRERRDKLSRGVNARAHTLLGKEEEQYADVMRKKAIVEADRAKLVQVMSSLDEKKRRALVQACSQVNKDFGSIFSALLPGAQAKLEPPEGMSVLEGLEVKVGFNNAWKESLGELSGGQRSLVALSLILAMLLFKPAPLYILDEVDAALDLSHTQNIGTMLKEHFKHSQFIIVSLKDGMFNNANVLFRTKFVDGMSTVQRTLNSRR